jgi:hypothetical protein
MQLMTESSSIFLAAPHTQRSLLGRHLEAEMQSETQSDEKSNAVAGGSRKDSSNSSSAPCIRLGKKTMALAAPP